MRRLGAILILVTVFEILACGDRKGKNYNNEALADNAKVFVQTAHEAGLAEIQLSQLALKQSKDTSITLMAKRIIADHTDADAQLKKIAGEAKIALSDTLTTIHNEALNSLKTKSDTAFDKAYSQIMVNDHEKAIKLFNAAIESTEGDVQNFAKGTLPKLQSICKDMK
jgi:putative membrane protein